MDSVPAVTPQAYMERMRSVTEKMLSEVMEAVNQAPDGAWINGSEMQVREVLAEYRRQAYEMALQMRVEAAEAAFSPDGEIDGSSSAQQGVGDSQHGDG
jgi:hypothetical protein